MDDVDAVVASYRRRCGQRVRTHREAQKLSLRAMAAQVGISFVTLGQVERGESGASDSVKIRIAQVLGVDFDELFRLDLVGAAA